MSKSVISIRRGTSTLGIVRRELDRVESFTGDRPKDWLMDIYDEHIDEYYGPDGFDFDAFEMFIGFVADSYIDFVCERPRSLELNFMS